MLIDQFANLSLILVWFGIATSTFLVMYGTLAGFDRLFPWLYEKIYIMIPVGLLVAVLWLHIMVVGFKYIRGIA